MTKKSVMIIGSLFFLNFATAAISEDIGFELSAEKDCPSQTGHSDAYNCIKITSTIDYLRIDRVSINKGNCAGFMMDILGPYPPLKNGETLELDLVCDPVEAEIETNTGYWYFSW